VGRASSLIWESRVLYRISGKVVTEDETGQSAQDEEADRGLGWGSGYFKH
jgi:hypothetical protein